MAAEKYVSKKVKATAVKGFAIVDGSPVEREYTLVGGKSEKKATAEIRKTEPTFMPVSVNVSTVVYRMPLAQFIESAAIDAPTAEGNALAESE